MKFLKTLLVLALFVVSTSAMAQQKFAVISANEILMKMPELADVQTKLQEVEQGLMADMEAIQKEYSTKFQEFQKNEATYTQTMKEQKQKDLQSLYSRYTSFESVAQQEMQEQQQILMTPIQERLFNAIKEVGDENAFVFIFDKSSMLYISESQVVDASPLVEAKLGIVAQ
ncbi:MAG: OmpH family outer membrane protein [Rikenellaceae bacterium]